jgi:hypothetical protein
MSAVRLLLAAAILAAAACDGGGIADPPPSDGALTFQLRGQSYALSGSPSGDPTKILDATFAVAHADSLTGFAVIGYQRTGENEGNLIVFQAPREVATFTCSEQGLPCDMRGDGEWHGRYIVGVRNLGTAGAQRYYHLVSGTLSVSSVGPDRLRATFTAVFRSDEPAETLTIEAGSIDVPYVSGQDVVPLLQCLIGSGAAHCT